MSNNELQQKVESIQDSQDKKTYTPKQRLWQQRAYSLYRLKGIVGALYNVEAVTESERIQLDTAFDLVNNVLSNFTESSKELGFNAQQRCNFCGCKKAALEGSIYCPEHHKIMLSENLI